MFNKQAEIDFEAKRQVIMENKIKKDVYVFAAAFIVMGLVMIIFPQFTLEMLCYLIAAVLGVLGIFNLVIYFTRDILKDVYRYDFVTGIMMILIAIIFVWRSQMMINLIPIIMGIIVFWNGITKFQRSIDLLRIGYSGWIFVMILALMSIAVGVFIILQPDFIAEAVMVIIGISLVFGGVSDIITLVLLGKRVKEIKKKLPIETEGRFISEEQKAEVVDSDGTIVPYEDKT
ncbi:MAG: DUF308 domain-containing protein [Lachnospiraceae bacterium]|nr:DUF308 domain-containing protein [Lachnospiraceae bacterium]